MFDCIHVHRFIDLIFLCSISSWNWLICCILGSGHRCPRFCHRGLYGRHEHPDTKLDANGLPGRARDPGSSRASTHRWPNSSNSCRHVSDYGGRPHSAQGRSSRKIRRGLSGRVWQTNDQARLANRSAASLLRMAILHIWQHEEDVDKDATRASIRYCAWGVQIAEFRLRFWRRKRLGMNEICVQ